MISMRSAAAVIVALSTTPCLGRDVIVADRILLDTHQLFRSMAGAEFVFTSDTPGCDESISAPLHTEHHSGYQIDFHECDEIPKAVMVSWWVCSRSSHASNHQHLLPPTPTTFAGCRTTCPALSLDR